MPRYQYKYRRPQRRRLPLKWILLALLVLGAVAYVRLAPTDIARWHQLEQVDTPGDLAQLKDVYNLDGDMVLPNGLELYKLPGHTSGSMAIVVPTAAGRYVITGDIPHLYLSLFPKSDKYELLGGEIIDITPAPDNMMPYLFNSVIYNHYDAYDSFNKLKCLAERFEPEFYLTGHDPWCINRHSFG